MKEFIEIPTAFPPLKTVKLQDSDTFRPAATDVNQDQARRKALMEELEIQASFNQQPGFVASAAHAELGQAIANAKREASERIAIAAWWALDRPVLGKAPVREVNNLREQYGVPKSFNLSIGYVQPHNRVGFATIAILENLATYPYIVLGASFNEDREIATIKAFTESVQSWTASAWEKENTNMLLSLWDMAELRRRANLINDAPDISDQSFEPTYSQELIQTAEYSEGYVAWVYANEFMSGRSVSLAKLAMKLDESIATFTDHNQ